VVAFWSIYCQPCVAEISSLLKFQERYPGKVKVVGVNTDGELPPARVRTFIERYEQFEDRKITYPIVFDEKNAITRQVGVGFLPTVMAVGTDGKVLGVFVGFEEKDEEDILAGIEALIPGLAKAEAAPPEERIFEVEAQLPACGFYDETGWKESFYGNRDVDKEVDRVAAVTRDLALKAALREALEKLGIDLAERETAMDCFRPYGVLLHEDPWRQRDSLTNLLNAINFRRYTRVQETAERWLGTAFHVRQKISVNMDRLWDELERAGVTRNPLSINFVVVNMRALDRMNFMDSVIAQSKFVGKADFPAFTVYTTQDAFIRELDKMDFGGPRVFIGDAGAGVIEAEAWR
jgi:thiol-disulfide isomerase/thioredoxin/RNAse (barnase) inhibitor barstar